MAIYRICAIVTILVTYLFNSCDCKCEEYLFLLKEIEFLGKYMFEPTSIPQSVNEFHLDSSDIANITNRYKGCYLELQCESKLSHCDLNPGPTNPSTHTLIPGNDIKSTNKNNSSSKDIIEGTNNSIQNDTSCNTTVTRCPYITDNTNYDVNILYLNENLQNNHTKTIIECDYEKTVCFNGNKSDNMNNISLSDIILKIDHTITTQPIFTNYYADFKTVNIICKFKDYKCEENARNISLDTISTENNLNVYLKTNYIQNNTRVKYANCSKNTDNNYTSNIECSTIEYVLFPEIDLEDSLILYCQLTKLNPNDTTLLDFKNCSYNKNITDEYKSQNHNITLVLENSGFHFDNIKSINTTINKDISSVSKEKDKIKVRIITDNKNNCSQSSLFSITEGNIVVLGKNNDNTIQAQHILQLKLSNCINNDGFIRNSSLTNLQTKLIIVLSNETLNTPYPKTINEELTEDKQDIILHCDDFDSAIQNATAFECKSIDLGEYNITEPKTFLKNTSQQKDEAKEKLNSKDINGSNKTQTKNNCLTDYNKCVTCDFTTQNGCNNHSNDNNTNILITNEETNNAESKTKPKKRYGNKTVADTVGTGPNSLPLGNETGDKVMLITISSIAGASLVIALALRKCPMKKPYHQAPTREPPLDVEESAF